MKAAKKSVCHRSAVTDNFLKQRKSVLSPQHDGTGGGTRWTRVATLALAFAVLLGLGISKDLYAAEGTSLSPRGGVIIEGDLISLEKNAEIAGGNEVARPGNLITYTLTITNDDAATLAAIVVTDTLPSDVSYVAGSTLIDTGSGPDGVADNPEAPVFPLANGYIISNLGAGEAAILSYLVEVNDSLDAGVNQIENLAEALALSELVTATLTLPAAGAPAIEVEKTTAFTLAEDAPGVLVRSGELVTWTYTVTNTGALSLTEVVLIDSDPMVTPTLAIEGFEGILAPGDLITYTAAGLAISGEYSNTAVVSASTAGAIPVTETVTATATSYYFGVEAGLELVKSAEPMEIDAGEVVTYSYALTNTGNVSLTNITVSDDFCSPLVMPGEEDAAEMDFALEAGDGLTLQCSQPLTVTTTNVATAVGTDVLGELITATAEITVTVLRAELMLTKTPSALEVSAGTPVTYSYGVSNTGDYTVTSLSLADDMCSPVEVAPGSEDAVENGLAPGVEAGFSCSMVISEPTTNTAVVSGLDPAGNPVTATATAFVDVPLGQMAFSKQASARYIRAGSMVTYTYTATNTGVLDWVELVVEDDRCGPVQPVGDEGMPVEPGSQREFACTTILVADTTNIATATASLADGSVISATASAFVDVAFYWAPILEKGDLPPADCPLEEGCPVAGVEDAKALAYHAGLERLYILSQDAQQVVMINPDTFAVVAQAATGNQPWGMALNQTTNLLYVSNSADSTISVYDATSLAVVGLISVEGNPGPMALLQNLDTLFVLTRPDSRVVVIEGQTVVQDVNAGGSGPFGIAADSTNARIYISHRDSASLSLLQHNGEMWEAVPGPLFEDGRQYFGLAWNDNSQKLYALAADVEGEWRLEVWSPEVTPPWSLLTAPALPSGGALDDPDVGGAGLAINPVTGMVYIANTGAASVSRVEGVNDTLVDSRAAGSQPFVLAVDGAMSRVFVGFRSNGHIATFSD